MTVEFEGWTPSKSLDLQSRQRKAKKIIALLGSWRSLKDARILDIGTGAGVQAAALAEVVGEEGSIVGIDVIDLRVVKEGFEFHLVEGTALPFERGSFDVVVSNLVIEHVGDRLDQLDHLREIRRVLADDGCAYVAMPNRWAPVEPHFGVPFLTWLPRRWRTPYLRRTGRAKVYDCDPLSWSEAISLFRRAGLDPQDQTYEALRLMMRFETPWIGSRLILRSPRLILRLLHPLIPTFIFRAVPAG